MEDNFEDLELFREADKERMAEFIERNMEALSKPQQFDDWFYDGILCRIMNINGKEVELRPYFAHEDIGTGKGESKNIPYNKFIDNSRLYQRYIPHNG